MKVSYLATTIVIITLTWATITLISGIHYYLYKNLNIKVKREATALVVAIGVLVALITFWMAALLLIAFGVAKWDYIQQPVMTLHGALVGFAGAAAQYLWPRDNNHDEKS